jgi:hypothetical protein
MSRQTMPAPVGDDVLERLEAELLRSPALLWSPEELDLAEALAPVIERIDHDPACRITRVRTNRWCCDY